MGSYFSSQIEYDYGEYIFCLSLEALENGALSVESSVNNTKFWVASDQKTWRTLAHSIPMQTRDLETNETRYYVAYMSVPDHEVDVIQQQIMQDSDIGYKVIVVPNSVAQWECQLIHETTGTFEPKAWSKGWQKTAYKPTDEFLKILKKDSVVEEDAEEKEDTAVAEEEWND
jgi:hypothetical protein